MENSEKKLSEMTIEELWQLFPVFLTDHKQCWNHSYEEELNIPETVIRKAKLNL
jgi:hypothetical protein